MLTDRLGERLARGGVANPMGDIWCKECIELNSNCKCASLSERELIGPLSSKPISEAKTGSADQPPARSEKLAVDPYALRSALVNIRIALTCLNPATTLERRIERATEQIDKALG